jgi:hypothetical protein
MQRGERCLKSKFIPPWSSIETVEPARTCANLAAVRRKISICSSELSRISSRGLESWKLRDNRGGWMWLLDFTRCGFAVVTDLYVFVSYPAWNT